MLTLIGAFGNVRYGWLRKDPKKKYAIKAMKKADIITSKHVDHIENEKKILEMISHPFIVSIRMADLIFAVDEILRVHARRQVHLLRH